jgi:hypothetical protein
MGDPLKSRITLLATGKARWVNDKTGVVSITHEAWHTRWKLAGPRVYSWWWVKRWGRLDCGCTRNPLTRRMVLINSSCVLHMGFDMWADEIDGTDDGGNDG